jgi:hypothetical protein
MNDHFPISSRYYGIDTALLEVTEDTTLPYLKRRFVPHPERFELLQEHGVSDGERLDHIAANYLGDAELFWRICDANRAMRPNSLTERIGRCLRITLPEGIPGATNV